MRAVLQRVSRANVSVDEAVVGSIGPGLLILLGIHKDDTLEKARWLAAKAADLRIFTDDTGKMNLSVKNLGLQVLVVSQFTLYANAVSGRRPDFFEAAEPIFAEKMYREFMAILERDHGLSVQQGAFGKKMQVELVNDGPVTILLETPNHKTI